jgi:predicted negative regulator of RcsB-dependent stress response
MEARLTLRSIEAIVAIKIKKKRPEAEEPEEMPEVDDAGAAYIEGDEILEASRQTFGWINDNRNMVMGGLVVLFVGIVAVSMFVDGADDRRAEAAAPAFEALNVATAPVGSDGVYPSIEAHSAALTEATGAVDGSATPLVANLLAGRAALQRGDAAAALTSYRGAVSVVEGTPEGAVAAFGVASAMADEDDLDGALALLDGIVAENEAWAFAAQLHRATLIDAAGDASAARDAWQSLLDDYPDRRGLEYATARVSFLEVANELAPTESAGDESEDGE